MNHKKITDIITQKILEKLNPEETESFIATWKPILEHNFRDTLYHVSWLCKPLNKVFSVFSHTTNYGIDIDGGGPYHYFNDWQYQIAAQNTGNKIMSNKSQLYNDFLAHIPTQGEKHEKAYFIANMFLFHTKNDIIYPGHYDQKAEKWQGVGTSVLLRLTDIESEEARNAVTISGSKELSLLHEIRSDKYPFHYITNDCSESHYMPGIVYRHK